MAPCRLSLSLQAETRWVVASQQFTPTYRKSVVGWPIYLYNTGERLVATKLSHKHPLEISPVCLQHLADHSFLSLPCLTLITRKSADLYQQGYQSRRPSSSGRMPMAADAL